MVAFAEVQHYSYVFIIAIGAILLVSMPIFWRYAEKKMYFYLFGIPYLLLSVYFITLRVEVKMNSVGICYRRYPLNYSYDTILWADVSYCEIRRLPIRRYSYLPQYALGSKYGLLVATHQGRIVLLGTAQPYEMKKAVSQIAPCGKWFDGNAH